MSLVYYLSDDGINYIPVTVATPLPVTGGGGGGGTPGDPTVVAGADGENPATQINPLPVTRAQGVIASGPLTLDAGVAATIIGAFPDRRGMRVLNYIETPVYLSLGTTGTPASGAGSDYIPAAVDGIPGQWEPPFAPVTGVRAVSASAGGLTVMVW